MTQKCCLLLVLVAGFPGLLAQPAVPPPDHPDVSVPGWSDLFLPDLANATGHEGVWSFTDRVLTASEDQPIWTRKTYRNFILDLEFRNADCTNSGVFVHASDLSQWVNRSVEIQIADNFCEQWAKAPGSWQCGAIFGHLPARANAVRRPGAWNRYTITCRDHMIWVLLNGQPVIEADLRDWTSATTNPDGSEIPTWLSTPLAELPTQGHVGLQGKHAGAPIWFRNLRIRELP